MIREMEMFLYPNLSIQETLKAHPVAQISGRLSKANPPSVSWIPLLPAILRNSNHSPFTLLSLQLFYFK